MILDINELLEAYPLPLLPTGEPFILNPLQREDLTVGVTLHRAGLFLPVGYGKTVISTLVALAWGDDHVIVCVKPTLVPQWVEWINSVGNSGGAIAYGMRPSKDGLTWASQGPAVRKALPLLKYRFWIMTYGIFRNDWKHLMKVLTDAKREYTTVIDEAQELKNPSSKLFQSVETFSNGRHLELLTGTELNKPDDAYAYIKLKTPLIYRSKAHFDNMHVVERDFFENPIKWKDLDLVTERLYMSSLHRTKEEVHKHLPKANYDSRGYTLSTEHMQLYTNVAESLIVETMQGGKIDGTTPQKLRNTLQQLIINWPLIAEDWTLRPAFLDYLDNVCDEIDVQDTHASKLIVWTWFKNSSRYLTQYLNDIGVPTVAAYSEVDSNRSIQAFMKDKAVRALVAQPGSAGAGLNPQYICWEMIFAEVPTRTIPFRQSAGRIDREGQRYNPNIRIALAKGTVQAQMYHDLLFNDGLVQRVQGNEFDLRKLVYSSASVGQG